MPTAVRVGVQVFFFYFPNPYLSIVVAVKYNISNLYNIHRTRIDRRHRARVLPTVISALQQNPEIWAFPDIAQGIAIACDLFS